MAMSASAAASVRLLVSSCAKSRVLVADLAAACTGNPSALLRPLAAFDSSIRSFTCSTAPRAAAGESPQGKPAEEPPKASSAAPSAEELRLRQVLEGIQTGYASVKAGIDKATEAARDASAKAADAAKAAGLGGSTDSSSYASSSGRSDSSSSEEAASSSGSSNILNSFMEDVRATLSPSTGITSATRRYTGPEADPSQFAQTAELMLVQEQQTAWQKTWSSLSEKLPFLKNLSSSRLQDTSVYKKGQEMVEDLKEKYETSDHPAVHKVEEMKERIMTGSEATQAMSIIRQRNPHFDLNHFVKCIKFDAPHVTKAFLQRELHVLEEHCGPELLERFSGIFKHFTEQGVTEDPTILHTSEVEIVEIRMMDDDPFIITQFNCQQLKCIRDKFGNVVEGSPDTIQRVFYFWGLQMEKSPIITPEGKLIPPRWVIKDMMWQSMLALV